VNLETVAQPSFLTGDDVDRTANCGKFEELVILRITAGCYLRIHIDPLRRARQSREKNSNIFLIDISTEMFPLKTS
jgi:hypothetical protein